MTEEQLYGYQCLLAVLTHDFAKSHPGNEHALAKAFTDINVPFCPDCRNTFEIDGIGGRKLRCDCVVWPDGK